MDCSPPGSSLHGDSPGKNTRGGYHALLQRIFLILGSPILCLLHNSMSLLEDTHFIGKINGSFAKFNKNDIGSKAKGCEFWVS